MSDTAVRVYEVSLRDGLQNEPEFVPTDVKLAYLDRLIDAGFTDIEVTSFVRPRWVPQLADAAEVVQRLPRIDGVRFWGLVPNKVGFERALDAGMENVATVLSASETHNRKNLNRTVRESLAALEQVVQVASDEHMRVRCYISTSFGCPYEGDVPVSHVVDLARQLLDAGADEVALGDTTGMGTPEQVKGIVHALYAADIASERIAMHFHDTQGTALVNAYAAWQEGIRSFDGSIAGIGGCPYAPGASGNAAMEDLIHMFHSMGVQTGVDLERSVEAATAMETALGRDLPGRYYRWARGQAEKKARARSA